MVFPTWANGQLTYCEKLEKLIDLLDKYHVEPVASTEENSKIIFNDILDDLDPNGYYFLQPEIDELRDYESTLLQFPYTQACVFYKEVENAYGNALVRTDSILEELEKHSFDFNKNELFYYDESNPYESSSSQLYQKWRMRIKVRNAVLSANKIDTDSSSVEDLNPKDNIDDAIEYYRCRIMDYKLFPDKVTNKLENTLLTAYCYAYDPHSTYFNENQHDNFISDLSGESLSYGIELSNSKDGEIVIEQIVPGSPAWKSNQIHKGDRIVSVKLENDKEIATTCATARTLQSALVFPTETLIKLKLKKAEGTLKEVELINEILENEENIIKSYVLKGEGKFGYIGLPGFYTEWNGENRLGSANDIGKEILKLKRENIQGLIFDLRYNGGGSVEEALQIAGTFIGEGSLAIEKEKDSKPRLLKDPHRGRVYTGPLIVMVNELSASASEITAGILQDHNRALIVGNRTFGKGTGQVIVPLDFTLSPDQHSMSINDSTAGYVKFTIGKYYNLKGSTHQGVGVSPDIEFPSLYDKFTYYENDYTTYIEPDSIIKKTYYTPYPVFPIQELKEKSASRIKTESRFAKIDSSYDVIEKHNSKYDSLNLSFYPLVKLLLKTDELLLDYDQLKELKHSDFTVSTPEYDKVIYQLSDQKQKIRDKTINEIQGDFLLRETYHIMMDLINVNNE
tara:strand:+ start:3305 stop:5347 length:2043 start_codon:yes stop_codon:yes gene_type:complete